MKRITCLLIGLIVFTIEASADVKKHTKGMSDDQIDKMFISFVKERQEEEKKKLEEKEKKEKQENKRSVFASEGNPYGSPTVYASDPNNQSTIGEKTYDVSVPSTVPQLNAYGEEKENMGFKIKGIQCDGNSCVAFTTSGTLKVGDRLGFDERITRINTMGIRTNKRKIKF